MVRFIGNIEAKLDAKGRLFVPAQFRKQLDKLADEGFVLCKDPLNPCLVIYPESVWNKKVDDLESKLSPWKRQDQALLRQFMHDSESIAIDNNGRMLLPKRYLLKAGIEADIKLLGGNGKIEIWNPETLEQSFMEPNLFEEALENAMQAQSAANNNITFTPN